MAHESLLIAVLILVAAAMLLQGWAVKRISDTVARIPGQIENIRADVNQRLDPIHRSVTEMLADSREPVRTITNNLAEISRILRERTGQADSVVEELLDKTRRQIIRVDGMVSNLVEKVESTSDRVERNVLVPIQEVAAVMKGVRAGLEFLFARRRGSSVSEATQDEQMFI